MIYVKKSELGGFGVFANKNMQKNQTIEVCQTILLSKQDRKILDKTKLYNYYFGWQGKAALALGYGSLYNHSYSPNAKYVKNYSANTITIIALRDIQEEEEILVNYNGDPSCMKQLWFKPKN